VRFRKLIVAGAAVVIPVVVALTIFSYMRRPQLTPALRGAVLAERFGCFACHGPGSTGGVPNPGSDDGEVPAWDGGTSMMYVENEGEIREWILYGHPKRLAEQHGHRASDKPDEGRAKGESADHAHDAGDSHAHGGEGPVQDDQSTVDTKEPRPLVQMPAFEDVLATGQVDDLVAYYKAVALYEQPPPEARQGLRVASRLGCFGCHGPGGRVGSRNARSFKGYIPPWQGKDYGELVRTDDELRQWILDGKIDRLESNPLARYFTRRQVIAMPAYRDILETGELEAILSYIHWLQEI
jgi:mono/diheme cytochrome c family protein